MILTQKKALYGIITLLFFQFNYLSLHGQTNVLTPYTFIDSLLISLHNDNFDQYQRQITSPKDQLIFNIVHRDSLSKEEEMESLLWQENWQNDTLIGTYLAFRETVEKYNIDEEDIGYKTFDIQSVHNKKGLRVGQLSVTYVDFYCDSMEIILWPRLYYIKNQWKADPSVCHIVVKPIQKINRDTLQKAHESIHNIKFLPESFENYSMRIFNLIKEKQINDLLNEFPNEKQLKSIGYFSEYGINYHLNKIAENKIRILKEIDKLKNIETSAETIKYRCVFGRNGVSGPNLTSTIYVKSDQGSLELKIRALVTENKIFIWDIQVKDGI